MIFRTSYNNQMYDFVDYSGHIDRILDHHLSSDHHGHNLPLNHDYGRDHTSSSTRK